MLLAIRAPPDSTLEIPSGSTPDNGVKDMHSSGDGTGSQKPKGFHKEEYDELLGYLNKKYELFINANKANDQSNQTQHQSNYSHSNQGHQQCQNNYFDNSIQIYQIKNIRV